MLQVQQSCQYQILGLNKQHQGRYPGLKLLQSQELLVWGGERS